MQMQNMNTLLKNWIGKNKDRILELGHWRRVYKFILAETGIAATAQTVYDICYPADVINCASASFVGFAVGYRSCAKNCNCYTARLSSAVSRSKQALTEAEKVAISSKRKETVNAKFGVDNVFLLPSIQQLAQVTKLKKYGDATYNNQAQAVSTNLSKYGVPNVMQVSAIAAANAATVKNIPEIVARTKQTKLDKYGDATYNNQAQAVSTNLSKYGVTNPSMTKLVQQKISQSMGNHFVKSHTVKYNVTPQFVPLDYVAGSNNKWKCNECQNVINGLALNGKFTRCYTCHPSGSIPENQVRDFVKSLGLVVVGNARDIIAPKEIDIYIPSHNVAIEYCGTYWHSEQFGKGKQYHAQKLKDCAAQGIRLITLFSTHWEASPGIVKSRIQQYLGMQTTKIYARQCSIVTISTATAREFLNNNHLQGYCNAVTKLGLYYNNQLVAVMTFSKSRFEKHKDEMIRYAVLQDTSVTGAASKLFKHHVKTTTATSITTYSDNTWGYTDFYEKLGFKLISRGTPGYFYINLKKNADVQLNRMQYQKHKLLSKGLTVDMTQTEYTNMLANGYDRVWDCGHSKFEYKIST